MTQRSPLNQRYQEENRAGKTRKSSASAKPKTERAATVRQPAPKTAKQKKAEARERERAQQARAEKLAAPYEQTEGYKRLRRIWWIMLGGAIACTALSFVLSSQEGMNGVSMAVMIAAYGLIIVAFYIDLGKIRRERKLYAATMANDNSKAARKEQKRKKAELREQEREASEKFEAAKAAEAEKAAQRGKGLLGRFRRGKDDAAETGAGEAGDQPAGAGADTGKPGK